MSTWDIYWLLKLDDIHVASQAALFLAIAAACLSLIASFNILEGLHDKEGDRYRATKRWCWRVVVSLSASGLFFAAAVVFLPTTKQMAVIWVAPKIASIENLDELSAESKEIYGLAKSWLRGQVTENKEK